MEYQFDLKPARYSKGMMAIICPSDTGYKSKASWLAEYYSNSRYSGRENAYILSKTAAQKFLASVAAGHTALVIGDRVLYDANHTEIKRIA